MNRANLEPFVATLSERVAKLKVGRGLDEGVVIGPLASDAAVEKMTRQVEDARDRGTKIACGGERLTGAGLE